jgi:archaellum component FlaC
MLVVNLDLENGVAIKGRVVMNNMYKGFKQDQQGLKEIVEKLEKNDERTLNEVANIAEVANSLMDDATGNTK